MMLITPVLVACSASILQKQTRFKMHYKTVLEMLACFKIQGIEACKANQHVRNMSSCREQYSKDAFIAVLFIHLGFYVSVQHSDI